MGTGPVALGGRGRVWAEHVGARALEGLPARLRQAGVRTRREGLRPAGQAVGFCSVVGGRTPRWHLVASLVGGLPEAHWKHHFLMQTNDGAAQRSPTAGRRS